MCGLLLLHKERKKGKRERERASPQNESTINLALTARNPRARCHVIDRFRSTSRGKRGKKSPRARKEKRRERERGTMGTWSCITHLAKKQTLSLTLFLSLSFFPSQLFVQPRSVISAPYSGWEEEGGALPSSLASCDPSLRAVLGISLLSWLPPPPTPRLLLLLLLLLLRSRLWHCRHSHLFLGTVFKYTFTVRARASSRRDEIRRVFCYLFMFLIWSRERSTSH